MKKTIYLMIMIFSIAPLFIAQANEAHFIIEFIDFDFSEHPDRFEIYRKKFGDSLKRDFIEELKLSKAKITTHFNHKQSMGVGEFISQKAVINGANFELDIERKEKTPEMLTLDFNLLLDLDGREIKYSKKSLNAFPNIPSYIDLNLSSTSKGKTIRVVYILWENDQANQKMDPLWTTPAE